MSERRVDLRSDIIAPATPEMLAAMAGAQVGVAMWGEDPAVQRLEAAGAAILGTEACCFLPNATSANLVAILAQTERGAAVVLDRISHIFEVEWYGLTALGGALPLTVSSERGRLDRAAVQTILAEREGGRAARVAVVVIENTHTFAGGVAIDASETRVIADLAHAHRAAVHLDGARLWNAAIALGVPPAALTDGVDTVAASLSKGLCAPGGALLGGGAIVIERAREIARQVGLGRTHKAGYLAAAGSIALETMIGRLADDHRRARTLAVGLAAIDGVAIDLAAVQTNLVVAHLDPRFGSSAEVAIRLARRGVQLLPYSGGRLRAVTHRGVGDDDIALALGAIGAELWGAPRTNKELLS
jgi:threonine aldolase